ncbi:MAG: hypothetical protein OEW08_14825 [Gammaproteobacteria bacterium]|nr:hypothetical protein [Gammaproteobacteria bacterium]
MSKRVLGLCISLVLSLAAAGASAITTPNKGNAPPVAGPVDAFRNNIAGLTFAIDSGQFHGRRLAGLYQFRGILRSDLMELQPALEDLGKAIRLDAKNPENHLQYANVLAKLKRDDAALAALNKAEKLNPRLPALYMQRGYIYYYRHQHRQALSAFEQAWKLNTKDAYSLLWIYIAAEKTSGQGRAALATRIADITLDEWPGKLLKLYVGGLDVAQFTAELSADRPSPWQEVEAHFYLGQFLNVNGEREAAAQAFQRAQGMHLVEFIEHHLALRELEARLGEL